MASNDERSSGPKIGEYPADDDSHKAPVETTSDPSSLLSAVKARKDEFTRHQTVHVKVGTWNVAAIAGTEKDVGKWFVQRRGVYGQLSGSFPAGSQKDEGPEPSITEGGASSMELPPDQVDLYVLGLQEIVDLSSPTEALRPYTDPGPAKRWKEAVEAALPPGYRLVAEIQLVGLLQLIYAAPSIADSVSAVSSTSVGTGLLGYMGNKGAVATRLLLGETTCMIFVNCHLAAGSDKASLDRRNWDASQIVGRTKFDSIDPDYTLRDEPSESIGDEDFAFWIGDLNYRLEDIPGDDVRQVLARHTENEYDKRHQRFAEVNGAVSSPRVANEDGRSQSPVSEELPNKVQSLDLEALDPHQDPASLQTTISSLFPHDQLRMQQDKQKAFHEGWQEGQISFLPTYKYDVGSVARFDSSEKHRGPSWCDRILFRSRRDKQRYERLVKESAEARKRDEEMKARGLESAAADDSVLFDYDPDVDGAESGDEYDPDEDEANEDAPPDLDVERDDGIRLDYYLSHQGVLSSDHKPLVAGFTLELECVDHKLKAQVHQEVVRELDKAENESRPGLTVVVDNHGHEASKRSETDPNDVDFGAIKLDVPVSRSVTVANTSGVSATFSIQKPERGAETPSWLEFRVEPSHHDESGDHKPEPNECTLLPGDIAMVEVTVCVRDIDFVHFLNDGQVKLEEVLVLRVKDGKDHFISAYGEWLPTAFGRSLEELTHIPEAGARSLARIPANSHEDKHRVPISAPRELFKLTEAISELTERAVAEWDMVKGQSDDKAPWEREPHGAAWPFGPETWTLKDKEARSPLLAQARDALDTNTDFSQAFAPEVSSMHRLEVLSETLVSFLRSLKDGVISASLWQDLDQQIQAREKAKQPLQSWEDSQAWVLENLAYSPAHSVSFTFVTFMLARIANEIAPVPSKPAPSTKEPKDTSRDSKDGPSSPSSPVSAASFISGGSFRRKPVPPPPSAQDTTISAMNQRRQAVETALATLFSSVLISAQVPIPSKDKERRALEERKRSIIEPFLKAIGVDNNGPSGGA
ncbi:Endonuclease/exonuclease/phosphatase [Aspergillus keveii]|uniref:Endonuclease/exonuclease/phosphatase n=1 Tax=Aspergillus keveii TaxID=714993 RepID=A0ABR4GDB8_9EURO